MPKVVKLSSDIDVCKGPKDSIDHSWIMSIDWLVASCCDDGDLLFVNFFSEIKKTHVSGSRGVECRLFSLRR